MKEMLTYVSKLYRDGVLDKEFSTLDSAVFEQKIIQGDAFIFIDGITNLTRYNLQGKELNPDYSLVPMYPPTGLNGTATAGRKNPWVQACVFPATLADDPEHLDAVLKYIDWTFSDEAELLLSFGKEGETYETSEDGKLKYLDSNVDYKVDFGLNHNMITNRLHMDVLTSGYSAEANEIFDKIMEDKCIKNTNPVSPLDEDALEEVSIYSANLIDYVNQSMEKFIFGTLDVEKDWDTFVAECNKLGAEKLQAEYDEAMASK